MAPKILLGTGHGTSAHWWSVGVILFELIVGIPPFNVEQPQMIFDNILNRNIPWPAVPEEMSHGARISLTRKLLELTSCRRRCILKIVLVVCSCVELQKFSGVYLNARVQYRA